MSDCSDSQSVSDRDSQDGEETWDDWTEEPQRAQSLFDDSTHPSPQAALQHDKQQHGVDLALIASTLDFFERIRLINWIRKTKPDPKSLARLDRNSSFLDDDDYLRPIIEDDALLQIDFDSLTLSQEADNSSIPAPSGSSSADPSLPRGGTELVDALRAQLADSNAALEKLKTIIQERLGDSMGISEARGDTTAVPRTAAPSVYSGKGKASVDGQSAAAPERDDDSHYFESYSYNEIHEIMIKDRVRTDAYRNFILNNPQIFKDAVVLDVGCGSGILSMFAAQSGAKKVYAVDASAVAFKAERNIKANGFSEVITVVKGKVENIDLPEKVDVIVSEWMGYFLLYECMLDSVLHARDRFLKPNGLMVPSQTSIMLSLFAGDRIETDRIRFWDDVYGFKMDAMRDELRDEAMIDVVPGTELVSKAPAVLRDIVTQTVTVPELSFTAPFELTAARPSTVRAFLGHFDTFFTADGRPADARLGAQALKDQEVFFTTGPEDTPTHWKQTVFLLKEPFQVEEGTTVTGTMTCGKNPDNSRELVVEMTWQITDKEGKKSDVKAQVWKVR